MSFRSRLSRCPIPHDADRVGDVSARFSAESPEILALLTGTAGCSPYLGGLILREADWLDATLAGAPEAAVAAECAAFADLSSDELPAALRRAKRRIALLTGLADLGGVWPLETVTYTLTDFADASLQAGMSALVADEIRRGRIPGATPEDAHRAAGMVAVAMGKMGAGELNYSSDIDLILLFDETRFDADAASEARMIFIRIVRRLTAMLSDNTADGYVFRTDLRLRPDAAVTPVCISMGAAEQYYEAQGRTWERAAYIKARAAAGDIAAGERFLTTLTPFVWRKHLDFAAIQDAHDMRLRIRAHKGLQGPLSIDGHNLKLGRGGIREIEFFTQTRQLIAGGRDPDLRVRGTVPGLAALAQKGWIPAEVAAELTADYRAHREVEHRVQMVNDAQTHLLPATPDGWDRLARMMGEGDTRRLKAALRARLDRVAERTEGFFAPGEAGPRAEPRPDVPAEIQRVVDGWGSYPALRSERAVTIFKRLQPEILSRLMRAASPEEALRQFDGFLSGLPAGVQLFALFEANHQLIDLIVDICATAPGLATYLSRNARVLDAVLGGDFFKPWPGCASLRQLLAESMARVPDYERKLDAARVFAREWHFRIGVHHLRGLIDAGTAAREYSDLAGAIVAALWDPVSAEFARKHGAMPGRGAVVLGMGSLGAEHLNAASDLDLLVIYDAPGDAMSDGPRALNARPYFARLTQAFVTALTAPMAEGRLYEVDMRLRPSGRQGPVAVSLTAFRDYQMTEAWTWEHLALTRARVVAGHPALAGDVETARREVLAAKAGEARIVPDTAEMRARIFAAKSPEGAWEAKIGPGRLQDIELYAQSLALRGADPSRRCDAQIRGAAKAGRLDKPAADALLAAYRFLWDLHAGGRLLTPGPLDPDTLGEGGRAFLLRETGAPGVAALAERLMSVAERTAGVISAGLDMGPAPGRQAKETQ